MFKEEHRDVGYELQKMKVENPKDYSLTESILVVLRNCRRFRELVSNQIYFEFLKDHFKNQKALQPIVAFFNFIYSSYTVPEEATAAEFHMILEQIRKEHKEYADPKKVNDIELTLLAISYSFRYLVSIMEKHQSGKTQFEQLLLELIKSPPEEICRVKTLGVVINALYMDFLEEKPQSMDVEGTEAKLEVLRSNLKVLSKMVTKPESIKTTYSEFQIFFSQRSFDDEESKVFNKLLETFSDKVAEFYGEKQYLNSSLLKPIHLNFLKDECKLTRYDLQNQVNFGYININFRYVSHTKTVSCTLTGHIPKKNLVKDNKEPHELESVLSTRITYTQKLTVEHPGLAMYSNLFRLPKIKKYLHRINEIDPNLDIVNDYDVIAYVQARDEASGKNYFRFIEVEERIDKVMHGDIASIFSIIFMNERRLCNRHAMKIFFTSRLVRLNTMTDPGSSIYVSLDNEEHLIHFVEYLQKNFCFGSKAKEKGDKLINKLLKKLIFYLPSTLETQEEIMLVRKQSTELRLSKDTPLQEIFENLTRISKTRLFKEEDPERHMYLSCAIDADADDDFKPTNKTDDKNSFESLEKEKKAAESVILNTSLTDILDFVLNNVKIAVNNPIQLTSSKKKEKPPSFDSNSVWNYIDRYPASFFLPTYLIVNVFDIRKLLELGDDLDFDYLESKLKKTIDPISHHYSLTAIICQKKDSNPLIYYPCVRQQSTARLDSKLLKGFIGGEEKLAPVHKVNKELVHYLVFEREVIQFK